MPTFVDCFFETVSGFTTTGASILTEIEHLGRGVLFWRSFTHWVGGMGVLVFVMAIFPTSDGHGMHLLRAEVPGPVVGKLVSRLGDTAKILYGIYLVMTVVEIALLLLGGMPLFDACVHAFGTAGTGGFSCRNLSVGAYNSPYFDIVIGVFMLLFGVNFNLYYFLLIGKVREVLQSEELRTYFLIVAAATITIAWNISHLFESFSTALRYAFFQVSSIITTTGYATADFNLWPAYSRVVLVLLMFAGACAGSTGGGIKIARLVILVKTAVSDMRQMLHPNAVATVRMEGRPVSGKVVRSTHVFLVVYLLVMGISTLLLSLDGFDLVTTFTAVVSCINNIGPGLELVGPMGNFAAFSPAAKLLLTFDMLAGRLELFPMLLLAPSLWRRHRLHR
jgi:trk system potassium uptake protein TrkH